MTERPILFSGPMVRAILDDRKTQTRRIVKLPADLTEGPRYWTTPSGRPERGYADPGVNYWTPSGNHIDPCPFGFLGDRLWVRETLKISRFTGKNDGRPLLSYAATHIPVHIAGARGWTQSRIESHIERSQQLVPKDPFFVPSIYMPRWASRITLEVTAVRVERLQDIRAADVVAEGVELTRPEVTAEHGVDAEARACFGELWDSINEKRGQGWDSNPWVWVIEFRRVERGL